MSSNVNNMAWLEDQRFGHILIQDRGGVYSLDLYETPGHDLVCRGVYKPNKVTEDRRVGRSIPDSVLVEIDLRADSEARLWSEDEYAYVVSRSEHEPTPGEHFSFHGGVFSGGWQVSPPIRRPGRTVWTGYFGGEVPTTTPKFGFVLKLYGTVDPVELLLLIIFVLIYFERANEEQAYECYTQAVEMCGERNVKSINVN